MLLFASPPGHRTATQFPSTIAFSLFFISPRDVVGFYDIITLFFFYFARADPRGVLYAYTVPAHSVISRKAVLRRDV